MSIGTITSKGQITIPKDVRDTLHLVPGSRVRFVKNEHGLYELHLEPRSLKALAGALRYSGKPKSLKEMDDAIAGAAAESMR